MKKNLASGAYKAGMRAQKVARLWGWGKQLGQIVYEKVPLPVPFLLFDVFRGKGLISQTPIPRGSLGYYGRLGATTAQGIFRGTAITQGKYIINNAKGALGSLLGGEIPHEIDTATIIATSSLIGGSLFYWLMIKPGDFYEERKLYRQGK